MAIILSPYKTLSEHNTLQLSTLIIRVIWYFNTISGVCKTCNGLRCFGLLKVSM